MKMTTISIVAMIAMLLSGCSPKTEYIYIEPKPYNFQTTEQPKPRNIRVMKSDEELYKGYITNFRDIIDFHNLQILDYKKSFEKGK